MDSQVATEVAFGEHLNKRLSMSLKNRLRCYAACFAVGTLVSFLSIITLVNIKRKPYQFAILYTLGNIIAIASSAFLWDPWYQLRCMFKPPRVYSSVVYISCIIITIVVVSTKPKAAAVVVLVLIQSLAGLWFTVAAIPFAQTAIRRLFFSL
uniref:Vesicle transport protein n=1 Tax=Lygus hesperus TaxID=30085 RepID=A0A0A9YEY9_LYGHE